MSQCYYPCDLTAEETLKYPFVGSMFPPSRSFVTVRDVESYSYQNKNFDRQNFFYNDVFVVRNSHQVKSSVLNKLLQ